MLEFLVSRRNIVSAVKPFSSNYAARDSARRARGCVYLQSARRDADGAKGGQRSRSSLRLMLCEDQRTVVCLTFL